MASMGHVHGLDRAPRLSSGVDTSPPVDLDRALEAAREGDEEAFRTLYRQVQPRLLRYLRTLVGQEAEDVASEAWLHIAKDIGSFSGDIDRFRAWTATIARHRALDHLRYLQRRPTENTPHGHLPERPAPENPENQALDTLSTQAALSLIACLPRDQAEIVVLRVVVGLDAKTVARIVGKRPGTVRTAAHRGLRRLERLLNDVGHPV
jgi:RNA polymerase sigma-70 factor (ECF subfamily)